MKWRNMDNLISCKNKLTKVTRPTNTQWLENLEEVELFINDRLSYDPYNENIDRHYEVRSFS